MLEVIYSPENKMVNISTPNDSFKIDPNYCGALLFCKILFNEPLDKHDIKALLIAHLKQETKDKKLDRRFNNLIKLKEKNAHD